MSAFGLPSIVLHLTTQCPCCYVFACHPQVKIFKARFSCESCLPSLHLSVLLLSTWLTRICDQLPLLPPNLSPHTLRQAFPLKALDRKPLLVSTKVRLKAQLGHVLRADLVLGEPKEPTTNSTPLTIRLGSYEGQFTRNSRKKAEPELVRAQIQRDMEGSLISGVPFDDFVREVWGFDQKKLFLSKWKKRFALDAKMLDVYKECGDETELYLPFMVMLMHAILAYVDAMEDLGKQHEVSFPCGIFFDTGTGHDIVLGRGDIDRKPDGSATSAAGHLLFQRRRRIDDDKKKKKPDLYFLSLLWIHILAWFEFKKPKKVKPSPLSKDPPKHSAKTPMPSEPIRPDAGQSTKKRAAKEPLDSPKSKRTKVEAASEQPPLSKPPAFLTDQKWKIIKEEAQAIEYAHETLRTGRRLWSTGVYIDKYEVSLWFIDRMGAICSNTIDFRDDPELILLLAVAIASATLEKLGFDPRIQPTTPQPPLTVKYTWKRKRKDADEYGVQSLFDELQEFYEANGCYAPTELPWKDLVLNLPLRLDVADTPLPRTDLTDPPSQAPLADVASLTDTASTPSASHPLPDVVFRCTDELLHMQAGVIGRGTSVIPLKPPSGPTYESFPERLVAKRSWQPKDRLAEDDIIRHIRSLITPRWREHVTDVRGSMTENQTDLHSPRENLTMIAKREAQKWMDDQRTKDKSKLTTADIRDCKLYNAFIGAVHEERVYRTLICVRNFRLEEVESVEEFLRVFLDVVNGKSRNKLLIDFILITDAVLAHYVVYTEAHVLHRDLSVNNIMFKRGPDNRAIGVLNDWDLASPQGPYARTKPMSKHRTGTAAFMALELLANEGGQIKHEYRHDLESFAWILIWCAFEFHLSGKVVGFENRYDELKEWTDTVNWNTLRNTKFMFVKLGLATHTAHIPAPMSGLKDLLDLLFDSMWRTFRDQDLTRAARQSEPPPSEPAPAVTGFLAQYRTKQKEKRPREMPSYNFFAFEEFMDVLEPAVDDHVKALELDPPSR